MFQSFGKKNKQTQAVKPQATEKVVGTLYYRVGKNGTETNFLDWFRKSLSMQQNIVKLQGNSSAKNTIWIKN